MTTPKRAPRKSTAALNQIIYTAVIEILNQDGYEQVTFNNVSKRAGVGRPVLYRRFDDPFTMVVDAEEYFSDDEITSYDDIDFSGKNLRTNLIDSLAHFNGSPQFMRAFLIELGKGTPTVTKFFATMRQQNLYIMERMLSQAQLNGEILHTVTDNVKLLPFNMLLYQALVDQQPVSESFVTQLVDTIVLPAILAQQTNTTDE